MELYKDRILEIKDKCDDLELKIEKEKIKSKVLEAGLSKQFQTEKQMIKMFEEQGIYKDHLAKNYFKK
jgi:hypothetical protein